MRDAGEATEGRVAERLHQSARREQRLRARRGRGGDHEHDHPRADQKVADREDVREREAARDRAAPRGAGRERPWPARASRTRGPPGFVPAPERRSIGRRGLSAPGDAITSLSAEGQPLTLGGTSVAVPFVTGTIALLWSEFPAAMAAQIKLAISQASAPRRASVVPPLLDAATAYQSLLTANVRR